MKNKTTLELAFRLNEIMVEQNKLQLQSVELDREYNEIVYELWDRYPHLRDDVNLQPITRVRKKEIKDDR